MMGSFLTDNPDLYFGSLVVFVKGGAPVFELIPVENFDPVWGLFFRDQGLPFGCLHLNGDAVLFTLAGEDRLMAIEELLRNKDKPDLPKGFTSAKVSVIVVSPRNSEAVEAFKEFSMGVQLDIF